MQAKSSQNRIGSSSGRVWTWGSLACVACVALGTPFSIFLMELGVFGALLLSLFHWRTATAPLRAATPMAVALAFYWLVQLISILYSQHPLRSIICLRGDWPVLFLPIMLAVTQSAKNRRIGLALFIGSAALAGSLGLVQHLTGIDPFGDAVLEGDGTGRYFAVGSFHGHLTYGGVMLFAFTAALITAVTARSRLRFLLFAAAALCGAGLLASYARTAWFGAGLGLLAGLAVVILGPRYKSSSRRIAWNVVVPGLIFAAVCVVALFMMPGLRDRLFGLSDFSEKPRIRLWGTALNIFRDFPVFGAGLGSYKSHFATYCLPGEYKATGHPHSDLLNVLTHSGLAGIVAWVCLWMTIIRSGFQNRGAHLKGILASPSALISATAVALFAGGLGQCYFTDEEPAAAFWFLIALAINAAAGARGFSRDSTESGKETP
jgi:O-antigen ligase